MYACICIFGWVCNVAYLNMSMCTYVNMCVYTCTCLCVYVFIHICVYVRMHAHMCVDFIEYRKQYCSKLTITLFVVACVDRCGDWYVGASCNCDEDCGMYDDCCSDYTTLC